MVRHRDDGAEDHRAPRSIPHGGFSVTGTATLNLGGPFARALTEGPSNPTFQMTVVREPEAIRIGRQAAPLRAPGVFCLRVSASFQARVPSGGLPPGRALGQALALWLRLCAPAVPVRRGQRSDTGPEASMTTWNAASGLDWEHLPPDLAPTACTCRAASRGAGTSSGQSSAGPCRDRA